MKDIEYKVVKEPESVSFVSEFKDQPDTVDWIRRQLEVEGNDWAWCVITIEARYGEFVGRASLGCCSYRNLNDFLMCDYYKDMKTEAADALVKAMRTSIKRGEEAKAALYELG
jgi:hypothetical protein